MKKIKFTSGKLERISSEYWNLTLFNADNVVIYKGTLDENTALETIEKHYPKIAVIK